MTVVLRRDENGRELLWKCSSCGQPFDLGWGDQCNACLTAERRHRELVAAVQPQNESEEREAIIPPLSKADGGGPRKAIEIASAWVNGEASIEDVRKASAAAASASYAANAYAYAANARTLVLAECADIVRKEIPQPYTERP